MLVNRQHGIGTHRPMTAGALETFQSAQDSVVFNALFRRYRDRCCGVQSVMCARVRWSRSCSSLKWQLKSKKLAD